MTVPTINTKPMKVSNEEFAYHQYKKTSKSDDGQGLSYDMKFSACVRACMYYNNKQLMHPFINLINVYLIFRSKIMFICEQFDGTFYPDYAPVRCCSTYRKHSHASFTMFTYCIDGIMSQLDFLVCYTRM